MGWIPQSVSGRHCVPLPPPSRPQQFFPIPGMLIPGIPGPPWTKACGGGGLQ